jgi:hypothetical protein
VSVPYHLLARRDGRYRWWRPLVESALFAVLVVVFTLGFGAVMRGAAALSGVGATEDGSADPAWDIAFAFGSVAIALPAVLVAVRCAGSRRPATVSGVVGRLLVAPYVDEEVAWAIQKHESLRYFADESVGNTYPEAYIDMFGVDYQPPEYVRRDFEAARRHRWYMTSRLVTINDIYSFDPNAVVGFEEFEDVAGRNFRQPREGLGFDGSPSAHMWRTMIWPNNFL